MIRVGFVLPHLRVGGAERCVVNWLRALDRAAFAPQLFLKRLEGDFLDLVPADVPVVALGGARAMRLPGAIGAALAAARIDVAYAATNAMNLALLAARTGARRIVSEHTPPDAYLAEAKLAWPRRMAMRHLYPGADAVAVPTDAIGDSLQATLGRRLPVAVLPNPVIDAGAAIPRRQTGPGFRIVAAGRLVPAKGFDTLIDACAILARGGGDFAVEIHGEGPLREALAARIDAAGLAGRVTLPGHADLASAYARADLFVLSSRREGFGNVLVEAMAAGVPVLATRSGGPETFIADRVNGRLVAPEDPEALAAAIRTFIDSPDRDATVAAGRETASRYSIAGSTEAFAALATRIAATRSMAA